MSLNLDEIHFTDLLTYNGFCTTALENMFGTSLDWDRINDIKSNTEDAMLWKWNHHSNKAFIASSVYEHLNSDIHSVDN